MCHPYITTAISFSDFWFFMSQPHQLFSSHEVPNGIILFFASMEFIGSKASIRMIKGTSKF